MFCLKSRHMTSVSSLYFAGCCLFHFTVKYGIRCLWTFNSAVNWRIEVEFVSFFPLYYVMFRHSLPSAFNNFALSFHSLGWGFLFHFITTAPSHNAFILKLTDLQYAHTNLINSSKQVTASPTLCVCVCGGGGGAVLDKAWPAKKFVSA
jgi:hypothetical protein